MATGKSKPRSKVHLLTDLALRRFTIAANRRYFGGKININWVGFRPIPGFSGKTTFQLYDVYKPGAKQPYKEVVMACIFIAARLRRHGDLCKMTVYHELVHAESDMLGYRGKKNSCQKSAVRFNQRMAELAQAGAFNGLW